MVERRHAVNAFRPSRPAAVARTATRGQTAVMLIGLLAVAVAVAVASFAVTPTRARSFDLFYGSTFIDDNLSPVAVDLASGKPTVRLNNALTAVGAQTSGELEMVPLTGATLMLNTQSGTFNMVDQSGFVLKPTGGGVRLPARAAASAVASGESAYLVQSLSGSSGVYLVGPSTVASAIGPTARAKARASIAFKQPVLPGPAGETSANGDLWVLVGTGDSHTVTRLGVPAGSNAGASLDATRHGSVTGVAALASATQNTDGSGADSVAVASAAGIDVNADTAATQHLPLPVAAGLDQILPVHDLQGSFRFLYHADDGWSLVTAPTDGGGGATVHRISAIPAAADLATPAAADNRVYTMATNGVGQMWQLDARGQAAPISGFAQYPIEASEPRVLTGAQVVAHGSRVIFNARANLQAVVVFADGSHEPRRIAKHSAVQLDTNGATTLTTTRQKRTGKNKANPAQPPKKSTSQSQPQVSDKVNCKTTSQTPNIPTVQLVERGSRSVQLSWNYPLLDPQDCAPSTYTVTVTPTDSNAPAPPAGQPIQGQNGVNVVGLFPDTTYRFLVTAYLNGKGTPSAPLTARTSIEGPAAPTALHVGVDSAGNWNLTWNTCGGVQAGCVPVASWQIIPRLCDGRGLANPPPTQTVVADPSVHTVALTYSGSDSLLGRGLSFQVEGVGEQGTIGTAASEKICAHSWTPPSVAGLRVSASQPATTSLGGSASTTVDVDLGSNPTRTVGGAGAQLTFRLTSAARSQTRTMTFTGASQLAASFANVQAGATYSATVTVAPAGHPSAAVTTAPVTVTTRANWPHLGASADCAGTGPIELSCQLTVHIRSLSSAQAHGETFQLTGSSGYTCGSTFFPLAKADFDPGSQAITASVDLLRANGTCTVSLGLLETPGSRTPLVFGATASPTVVTQVDLGHATTLDAGQGDFATSWSNHNGSSVLVRYVGIRSDAQVASITRGWQQQLNAPDATSCGTSTTQPTHDGSFLDVSPGSCVNRFGSQSGWRLAVSYYDAGTSRKHSFTYSLDDTPPGYVPCTVSPAGFGAQWDDSDPIVHVAFDPNSSQLNGCSKWQFTLRDVGQRQCDSTSQTPAAGAPIDLTGDSGCTPAPGYTVRVDYTDPAGGSHSFVLVTSNLPPAPTTTSSPTPTTSTP